MTPNKREAVAWCAGCQWYLDATDAGTLCPGTECGRTLRRRVGVICRDCEIHPIFFSSATYAAHVTAAEHGTRGNND